eukprot:scaffold103974_cov17-Tisochrysis_lutea.AAC.2
MQALDWGFVQIPNALPLEHLSILVTPPGTRHSSNAPTLRIWMHAPSCHCPIFCRQSPTSAATSHGRTLRLMVWIGLESVSGALSIHLALESCWK